MASKRPFQILALPLARLPHPRSSLSRTVAPAPAPAAGAALAPASGPGAVPVSPEPTLPSTQSLPAPVSPASASASASSSDAAERPLLLYQVLQPAPTPKSRPTASGDVASNSNSRIASVRTFIAGLPNTALDKASDTWMGLGQKDRTSWMYWFYSKGEGLMDKIEYEEWMLKGVHEGRGVKFGENGQIIGKVQIPLLTPRIPGGKLQPALPQLKDLLAQRIPYHRKMMIRSLVFSPATIPFAVIPVIPNFPLFYVLWRAWSHYRAWRGAFYLDQLDKAGLIVEEESTRLTEVYESQGVIVAEKGSENKAPDGTMGAASFSEKAQSSSLAKEKRSDAEIASLPKHSKGEEGAQDGTTTPDSLIYNSKTASKPPTGTGTGEMTSPTSKALDESAGRPDTDNAPTSKKGLPHPSLLLRPNQIPLLERTFGLTSLEVLDVHRALDQADLRAKAVDRRNAVADQSDKSQKSGSDPNEGKPGGSGTEWRGNLHR